MVNYFEKREYRMTEEEDCCFYDHLLYAPCHMKKLVK